MNWVFYYMISFFIFCIGIGMHLNRVEICNTDKSSRYALGEGTVYYITLKKTVLHNACAGVF